MPTDSHVPPADPLGGPPNSRPTVRTFGPERWGELDYFLQFAEANVSLSPRSRRALGGVKSHFMKVRRFRRIADQMRPSLNADYMELHVNGVSGLERAADFAVVVEAAIMELFGVIDSACVVIHGLYSRSCQGIPDSTSKLFRKIDGVTGPLPQEIRTAIKEAVWFTELLEIRSELTHLGTGQCRIDSIDGPVRYQLTGATMTDPFSTGDVIEWIDGRFELVNSFIGAVFRRLGDDLENGTNALCGFVSGKPLMRHIKPERPVTWQSGVCLSSQYLIPNGDTRCPWQDECQPHRRALANPPGPNGEVI